MINDEYQAPEHDMWTSPPKKWKLDVHVHVTALVVLALLECVLCVGLYFGDTPKAFLTHLLTFIEGMVTCLILCSVERVEL